MTSPRPAPLIYKRGVAETVRIRYQQYSLDERRNWCVFMYPGISAPAEISGFLCVVPQRQAQTYKRTKEEFSLLSDLYCRKQEKVPAPQSAAESEEKKMSDKTKKLTSGAMLCAIAYVVMVIGRVPVILFLKYDPKDVIITLGGLIWGPGMACIVSAVVSLIEMFTVSDTGIIGCIMNFISTCSFACTAAFIYKKKRTLAGAVVGLLTGAVVMTAVMLLWNYLITPLYMEATREQIVSMLPTVFLPFNLLKAGLNAAFTFLLYRPVITGLRKAGLVETSGSGKSKRIPWGLVFVAVRIIITCVLFILSMNGII